MADVKKKKSYNDHILVPKHEKISEKQKQQILEDFNCTLAQFPRIKITDPAIKDLSPRPGDIIKISRESKTESASAFYRVVSNE